MTLFQHIIIWLGVAVILYGVIAAGIAVRAIFSGRDKEYRARMEEFLIQKRAVEKQIQTTRDSMTNN